MPASYHRLIVSFVVLVLSFFAVPSFAGVMVPFSGEASRAFLLTKVRLRLTAKRRTACQSGEPAKFCGEFCAQAAKTPHCPVLQNRLNLARLTG